MRKHWMQLLSLLLTVVLLVVVFRQTQEVRALRDALGSMESRLFALENDVNGISGDVQRAIEEAEKLIVDYELQPLYVDPEQRTLETEIVITLKRWSEDAAVQVTAVAGRYTHITHLPVNERGVCRGQMAIPIDPESEVQLEAVVIQNGVTTRETLQSWGELSMLLPLRLGGHGGSVPIYENGTLTIYHYDAQLEDLHGQPEAGVDARYRLYVNGQMVMEEPQCQSWQYGCAVGDQVRLALSCADETGLLYEFTLLEAVCAEDGIVENNGHMPQGSLTAPGETEPMLTWN